MLNAARLWERHLFSRLDGTLASGTAAGLPGDGIAIASAHAVHAAELAVRAVGIPPDVFADYLRLIADAIEAGLPSLPILVDADMLGDGDHDGTVH